MATADATNQRDGLHLETVDYNNDEEPISLYDIDGYHPVNVGDVFQSRYEVVHKLGWGVDSTVYLTIDKTNKSYVALKILRASRYVDPPSDTMELNNLLKVKTEDPGHLGREYIVSLLDSFTHHGPNGKHPCFVFELMGPSIGALRWATPHRAFGTKMMKAIARHMLVSMDYLHTCCRVVHTDIKPGNFLIVTRATPSIIQSFIKDFPPHHIPDLPGSPSNLNGYLPISSWRLPYHDLDLTDDVKVKMIDLSRAQPRYAARSTVPIQPVALRAPEVIIGAGWDAPADIWSFGCTILELYKGRIFFRVDNKEGPLSPMTHLAMMEACFGAFPADLLDKGKLTHWYFKPEGSGYRLQPPRLPSRDIRTEIRAWMRDLHGESDEEIELFTNFILGALRLRPNDRLTARALLMHPWLEVSQSDADAWCPIM